jgi:hypothetical protein
MKRHGADISWGLTAIGALGVIAWLPLSELARGAAVLGASLSVAAGGLSALLVNRAHRRAGLAGAMVAIVVPFAVRAVLVVAGVLAVASADVSVPFISAFFAVFFVQLVLEVVLVLSRPAARAPHSSR